MGWIGHLWQGRFSSFVMDEAYTLQAARYIEMNPVAARMVRKAWRYEWSSAAAHIAKEDDGLVRVRPLLDMVQDWKSFVSGNVDDDLGTILESHAMSGWPLGNEAFLKKIEKIAERMVKPKPRGRPRKKQA